MLVALQENRSIKRSASSQDFHLFIWVWPVPRVKVKRLVVWLRHVCLD